MWTERTPEALADQLVLARGSEPDEEGRGGTRGRAVFLVGAGCSRSAGIPIASEVAQECAQLLAGKYRINDDAPAPEDPETAESALDWLIATGRLKRRPKREGRIDWGAYYTDFFDDHLVSANQQRQLFGDIIRRGKNKLNWAHICLGELVASRYVHTVLTTNFDQLILQGVIRTGLLPVVADGIESLTRITAEPTTPQIVHLHGSMHTYDPRNARKAIMSTERDPTLRSMLYTILHRCNVLVVVGYAGGEEGVMGLLRAAAGQLKPLQIFWVLRDQSSALSIGAENLMMDGDNKFVVRSDAAALFKIFLRRLRIGEPRWLSDPMSTLKLQSDRMATSGDPEIRRAIARFNARLKRIKEAAEHDEAAASEERKEQYRGERLEASILAGRYAQVLEELHETTDEPGHRELRRLRARTNLALAQEAAADDQAAHAGNEGRLASAIRDLESIVEDDAGPERIETLRQLLEALMNKYQTYDDKGALLEIFKRERQAVEAVAPTEDAAISIRLLLAQAHQQRGDDLRDGDGNAAREEYGKARSGFEAVLAGLGDPRADRRWSECKADLATTLQTLAAVKTEDRWSKASKIGLLIRALKHHRELLFMHLTARSPEQAGRLVNMANAINAQAELDDRYQSALYEAEALLKLAIDIYEVHGGRYHGGRTHDELREAERLLHEIQASLSS